MKKYEGLFILNLAGREESIKETIDKVSEEIVSAGGRVQNVQKMDRRPFSRVANRKHSSGFYVNILFEAETETIAALRGRFAMNEEVFRVLFTEAPKNPAPEAAAPAAS